MKVHTDARNETDRWPNAGIWEQSLLIKGRWWWNTLNLPRFYLWTQFFVWWTKRSLKKRGWGEKWQRNNQKTNGQEVSGAWWQWPLSGRESLRKGRGWKDSVCRRYLNLHLYPSYRCKEWESERGARRMPAAQSRSEPGGRLVGMRNWRWSSIQSPAIPLGAKQECSCHASTEIYDFFFCWCCKVPKVNILGFPGHKVLITTVQILSP